ncbi:hypothetical protein [Burkholderia sp. Ac-20349]|uniref:hypothetical protein n=1 Tax=Burkholderia sp. Ac-20349 TaxID=2703893 RepID=UPI00197C1E76|nr:hypothetical protein [Burkholderia sp. Ac-20349]MBN3839288.1 hypothetical protein [Burkholderia sp. Ac-20349]
MTIKVLCTLPNASLLINGVKFEHVIDGVVSVDELSQAHIDHFGAIAGYTIFDTDADSAAADTPGNAGEGAETAAPESAPDEAAQRPRGPRKARG